ncbi:hypothetical protein GOM49_16260 [Clostridium bovifaecis]|uniref:DUF3829 domain-containing protein n=1 Tax=Clostridium bovifaecis TaxID=2184719 RepID=A0A6I6FEX8_9CLOT|nr:hypothetical protein GOM49_16260 [Clostridium bovifaecis]
MKESNKKLLTTLSFIFGAIFIGVAVFYGTYYFFINKSQSSYSTKVKTEIGSINKINESSYVFTKGQTIDVNKIESSLSDSIASLQTSHSNLKNLVVTSKYSKDHTNLILGLENNILMYKQILSIVRNPKNPDLANSLVNLQKNRDDCMNYYALVSIKDIEITLPNESLEFLNNTVAYTQKQIRQNTDAQIVSSQNHDFLLSFNEISTRFSQIKKDYMNSVINSRTSLKGFDNLLNELNTTETALAKIKTDLSALAIPKDAVLVYESFGKVLDEYDTYIQNLKYSIKTEQLTSISGLPANESLDKLYNAPKEQIKVVESTYRSFAKLFNEFEDKTV